MLYVVKYLNLLEFIIIVMDDLIESASSDIPSFISQSQERRLQLNRQLQLAEISIFIDTHTNTQNLQPGEYYPYDYQSKKHLFGPVELGGGDTKKNWYKPDAGVVTKLYLQHLPPEVNASNEHQRALYERHSQDHPFFSYLGSVPGGWQTEHIPNQGTLDTYLKHGGVISREMADQAIADYNQMLGITGEAHGDLVALPPEHLDSFQRELLRKSYEMLYDTGYIRPEQILVSTTTPPRLVILDWGGCATPITLNNSQDTKSSPFKNTEKFLFEQGINQLVTKSDIK